MEFRRLRAKSAPPIIRTDDTAAQLRVATNALQFVKRIQGRQKSSSEKADGAAPTNCLSFEETGIFIASFITKTCLYNFDPLKPHFYIVKLGFTGVYIIFLICAQNRLWVHVRTASPRRF